MDEGLWSGRDEEGRRLDALLRAAASGSGGAVLVEGEPGAGKSALLARLRGDAHRSGYHVLHGTADELGRRFPLAAVLDCLGRGEAEGAARRARFLELLGDHDDDPIAPVVDAMVGWVTDRCRESPVLLVLDNAQSADSGSLRVWRALAEAAPALPLLVVAAIRPGPDRATLTVLREEFASLGVVVALAPLTPEQTADLVAALLGAPPGPLLCERLAGAGGNLRYVREMLDALRAAGVVEVLDGQAELADTETDFDVPGLSARSVAARLEPLSAEETDVLRAASLLGPGFRVPELAALTGAEAAVAARVVDGLAGNGVLEDAEGLLSFRHEAIREALYERMPRALLPAMHLHTARALDEAGSAPRAVAGQLLRVAGPLDDWSVTWIAAHADGLVRSTPGVAVELAERAAVRVPRDSAEGARLRDVQATGAARLRRPGAADQVSDLLDRTTAPARRQELHLMLLLGLAGEGRFAEALDAVDRALAERPEPEAAVAFHGIRAFLLWSASRLDEADALADRVLSGSAGPLGPLAESYAYYARGLVALTRRRHHRCLEAAEAARRVAGDAEETRDVLTLSTQLAAHVLAHHGRDDDRSRALLGEALALAGDAPGFLPWAHYCMATFTCRTGRWTDALTALRAALSGPQPDDQWLPVALHGIAAFIQGARGRREEARRSLDAIAHLPLNTGIPQTHVPYASMATAMLAEREGDPERALAALRPTLDGDWARELHSCHLWMPDVVRLGLATGDPDLARAALAACEREAGQLDESAASLAAARRCRGLIEEDPGLLRAALDDLAGTDSPPAVGATLEDLAVVLARHGRNDEARVQLNAAAAVYASLGADWYLARADARLRALGVRRGRAGTGGRPKSGWEALTPTELKVARLVAEGRSNPEIAGELILSPRTVQTHVAHIFGKLGVRSRVEIAREAAGKDVGARR
ncbi:AAA family ATPase [Streptomyces sp. NPDC001941]|uniref:ATP-binding protein n=1 Tax=Streptomyces sp. NPDC001941 TaxID=3154659 RepID=UPI00331FED20